MSGNPLQDEKSNQRRLPLIYPSKSNHELTIEYYHPNYDPCNFSSSHTINKCIMNDTKLITHSTISNAPPNKIMKLTLQDVMNVGKDTSKLLNYISPRFYKSEKPNDNIADNTIKSELKKGRVKSISIKREKGGVSSVNLNSLSTNELYNFLGDTKSNATKYLNNLKDMNIVIPQLIDRPSINENAKINILPNIQNFHNAMDHLVLESPRNYASNYNSVDNSPTVSLKHSNFHSKTRNTSPIKNVEHHCTIKAKTKKCGNKSPKSNYCSSPLHRDDLKISALERKEFSNKISDACSMRRKVVKMTEGHKVIREKRMSECCKNMIDCSSELDKYVLKSEHECNKQMNKIRNHNLCIAGNILHKAVTFRYKKNVD